jgi:hypothetical protein
MGVVLCPMIPPSVALLAGLAFAIPFATRWIYHWLAVSALVDPGSSGYLFMRRAAGALFFRWLPLPLRVLTVGLVLLDSLAILRCYPEQAESYMPHGCPLPSLTVALLLWIGLTCSLLIGLGIAGRFAAGAFLVVLLVCILPAGLDARNAVMLVAVILLLITDTGALSLWQPHDRLFRRRAAEPAS